MIFVRCRRWMPAPLFRWARRAWHDHYLARKYSQPDNPLLLRQFGYDIVPPSPLRHRVHGSPDLNSFLEYVERHYPLLQPVQGRVLDFGCGCGRTALAVRKHDEGVEYVGVDIDAECIGWASRALGWGTFVRSGPRPPLPFPDEHFHRVISISVFTHLPETLQDAWLSELARVSRAGALLTLSVHSEASNANLPRPQRRELVRAGFLFLESGLHPSAEYGNAYQTWDYIERHWGRWFEIEGRLSLDSVQDLVIMRRPQAPAEHPSAFAQAGASRTSGRG